jgi:hypothetical protein
LSIASFIISSMMLLGMLHSPSSSQLVASISLKCCGWWLQEQMLPLCRFCNCLHSLLGQWSYQQVHCKTNWSLVIFHPCTKYTTFLGDSSAWLSSQLFLRMLEIYQRYSAFFIYIDEEMLWMVKWTILTVTYMPSH